MTKNKLAKLLLEDKTVSDNTGVTKFGVEQIDNIYHILQGGLQKWDPSIVEYNPLVEIAKLAHLTISEELRFRCNAEIAKYIYPQIRSLEIQSKEDKEIKINIQIEDYAKKKAIEIEAEDIESEEIEETPHNYADYVLKRTKTNSDESSS